MIHNRLVNLRCYKAKQEWEERKATLTLVTCKSFPDYSKATIEQKLIPQGCD